MGKDKVLAYVAYFFPPMGGAGVQRSLKFARYLPEYGWHPKIITVREGHYWMQDPSLAEEIPPSVEVIRTRGLTGHSLLGRLHVRRGEETNLRRSGRMQGHLRAAARWFTIPDPFVGWVPHATLAARRILAESGAVLMTTSSPDSAHLVGLRIPAVMQGRIPWIADFRDPWVQRMSFDPPTNVHMRLQQRLEGRVVRHATRIVATSDGTRADFLQRYPDCNPRRIVVIPNGYDEEDFPPGDVAPDSSFLLMHVGQLNPERPVGPLLDCIEAFLEMRPDARDATRLELVGPHYIEDEDEVERRSLRPVVRFLGGASHRDAVALLMRARVLVLLEQESDRGGLILPGKIFEYLRARRPILALVPRGAAWDLITRLGAGECAAPSDAKAGATKLAAFYDSWRAGADLSSQVSSRDLLAFDRRSLTRRLAELLDEASAELHHE